MAKPTYSDLAFAERISQTINIIGGISEAARQIGVSIPSISRWRDGTSDPSRSNLVNLAKQAGVSVAWLATGEGSMHDAKEAPQAITGWDDNYEYVPFYKAEASAGHGSFLDEHREPTHYLAFRKRWLTAKGFALKDMVGLIARGDSMEPTVQNGAAIIVDTSRNEAMDGNVYVIRMGDRLWIKRTQWLPSGGLRLISDNKMYDSVDVTARDLEHDDIEVIGQVVHTAYDLIR